MILKEKNTSDDFSLAESGLFYRLLAKVGLDSSHKNYLAKRSLILALGTWAPLAILSAMQGIFIGNKVDIPFLYDITTHLRLLVVIPLLVFAEKSVDFRLNEFIDQFFNAGIIRASDRPLYMSVREKGKKLTNSLLADIIIFVIIVANISIRWKTNLDTDHTFWIQSPDQQTSGPSWAGSYFLIICMPIVQFILLRWLWRWVIWFYFFLKISKLPLRLQPLHADKSGGIGFLGTPPGPFLGVIFAICIIVSSGILEQVIYFNHKLPEYYPAIIAIVVFSVILNILPLMVFITPLAKSRRQAIFDYSLLVQKHHHGFGEKWIDSKDPGAILGNPDASSAADINSVFQSVEAMRLMPFNIKIMLSTVIISIIPMLPLLALQYSLADIVQKVLKLLL
jgi:hypothetical protein